MDQNPVFTRRVNANIGFYCQFDFSNAAGSPVVTFYASVKGQNWVRKTLKDPDTGKPIPELPLIGASGSDALEVNNWRADFIKIEITGATGGTIDAFMDYQENNYKY